MIASTALDFHSPQLRQTSATLPPKVEIDPADKPTGDVDAAIEPAYSIRMAEGACVPCSLCERMTGSGPVGYRGEKPICDLCLLECSQELGMVLALVAVVRAYASVEVTSTADRRGALAELGAFARIYDRFAAKSGPARRIPPRLSVH